jgi:aldehyde:ferredoxin oxidoreductase
MSGGYMGKLLFVDLSDGAIKEETLDENICRQRTELEGSSESHRQPILDCPPAGLRIGDIDTQVNLGMGYPDWNRFMTKPNKAKLLALDGMDGAAKDF